MTARILVIDEVSTIHRTSPSVQATISVGAAAMHSYEDKAADIVKRAGRALYRAKRDSRNGIFADAASASGATY
jgi:PleD family two-component response regulator